MLMHIDMVKTISYIDGIKGLHTNCRLASCFVSYINEHQSDYHGIAGPVCGESAAHWRIPLQTINSAELCCLINAFRIAGGTLMLD